MDETRSLELAVVCTAAPEVFAFLQQLGHVVKSREHGEWLLDLALSTIKDPNTDSDIIHTLIELGAMPSGRPSIQPPRLR